jgi:hypothetical protein
MSSYKTLFEKYDGDNVILKKLLTGNKSRLTAYKLIKDSANYSLGFENLDFKRTNTDLKLQLKRKLQEFKKVNSFLFPFITPIAVTVIVMQSKNHVIKDIDNLVKDFFVKNINTTIRAPEKPIVPYFLLSDNAMMKQMKAKGIMNHYQVIEIKYDENNDLENYGWIGFFLSDMDTFNDVFSLIEK